MSESMVSLVAVALASVGVHAALAEGGTDLSGTWMLDEILSDDPVRVMRDGVSGDGLGRRVARGVSIFGIPVGNLPPPAGADNEVEPEDGLRGVEHVFESIGRLRIEQDVAATEIRYGNAPAVTYRHEARDEREGAAVSVEWQNGILEIEHELADGARLSERYWVEARSGELHWTARLKRNKTPAADVKRIFYRARTAAP